MQPSICRGGGVGQIVWVEGGVSVSEGEGGGGGGPRDVSMQLSVRGGGGGEGLSVISKLPTEVIIVELVRGGGSTNLGAGADVRVEPGGGGGAVNFTGRFRCRAGFSVGFAKSVSFNCSRCILLLLLALDVCVGSEVLGSCLSCVGFSSLLAPGAVATLCSTNTRLLLALWARVEHFSGCVGCVVMVISASTSLELVLLSAGGLLGDVLGAVEAVGGSSFHLYSGGLGAGGRGIWLEVIWARVEHLSCRVGCVGMVVSASTVGELVLLLAGGLHDDVLGAVITVEYFSSCVGCVGMAISASEAGGLVLLLAGGLRGVVLGAAGAVECFSSSVGCVGMAISASTAGGLVLLLAGGLHGDVRGAAGAVGGFSFLLSSGGLEAGGKGI